MFEKSWEFGCLVGKIKGIKFWTKRSDQRRYFAQNTEIIANKSYKDDLLEIKVDKGDKSETR